MDVKARLEARLKEVSEKKRERVEKGDDVGMAYRAGKEMGLIFAIETVEECCDLETDDDLRTDGGTDGEERWHVDLGTGLGGWTAPFQDADGWRSVGLDIRDDLEADVVGDIRALPINVSPTVLTMSPPCTEFARWMLPWLDEPDPDLSLVRACLEAVQELQPDWWVLENSRGLHQFWKPARKRVGPYYLWGSFPPFDVRLTDGGKMSVSGEHPEERAKIPYALADSLRRSVEWNAPHQSTDRRTECVR